ncbi:MAG: M23 family metallopeptidase [Patescibacteria group bacterium]|jgi:hypothetical protein
MKYLLFAALSLFLFPAVVHAEGAIDIAFPVEGDVSFQDDFYAARSGGRVHSATDVMADKMSPILAAVDGQVTYAPSIEPSYGFMITLKGDDGYTYNYVHINNDTPGTDDGIGGVEHAYADGIAKGVRVIRGQHIAYVGDSGNAEETGSHLHFEICLGDVVLNPYASLVAAQSAVESSSIAAQGLSEVTSINDDKDIQAVTGTVNCTSDSLIRTLENSAVYYCGRDGGRYLFQDENTFLSWYDDFSSVTVISSETMGSIPLRGTVTYKPGTSLVKLLSVPKVYAVAKNGILRWIPSADIAESQYGAEWAKLVHDLPDGFFPAYSVGEDVTN